jgi:hypothetical protein
LTTVTQRGLWLVSALAACASITACGGGGGGAPPADVTGRVLVVSSGSPLSGATVNIGGVSFTTLADGIFTLRNVPSTATQILISAPGVQPLTQTLPTLTPNSVNDLGDIFVLNADDAGTYTAVASGKVVRADTLEGVPGAKVRLSGQAAVTDGAGNFSIPNLPIGLGNSGTAVGNIKAVGFEDKQIVLDFPLIASPPNNDLGQLLLAPPVGDTPGGPNNIKGKVSLTGQTELSGTVVSLIDKATGSVIATRTTASDGTFGFWVVTGNYTVRAEHAGPPAFAAKEQDVTLTRTDVPVVVNITL